MAFSVTIRNDMAKKFAQLEQISPAGVNPVIGRAGVNLLRDHFRNLESSRPNRLGGPRTHFYNQAARSTHFVTLPDSVALSVNQVGIRQRFQGGEIRPRNSKYLTIPAIAEAYGKRAREFNNLRFVMLKNGPALVEAEATQISIGKKGVKNKGSVGGRVLYWLRRKVTQKADPSVLPSPEAIRATALGAVDK